MAMQKLQRTQQPAAKASTPAAKQKSFGSTGGSYRGTGNTATQSRSSGENEFANALATVTSSNAVTDGPASIRTPELDSAVGNTNATGPISEYANPDNWTGDAGLYLQMGGDVDMATVRGLDNIGRRYLGDMAGGIRNTINEAGYLAQGSMGGMQNDPTLSGDAALYMQTFGDEIPEVEELKRTTDFGQNFQNETQRLYGDMTGGWKTAADLAGTIGQQTPAMALNLIPGAGQALSSAYLFGSAAGAATEEAAANGANPYEAMQYGVASGAMEAVTERIFDGMSGLLGKGAADDVVEAVIGKLTAKNGSAALRNALRLGFGALGEGAEEGISALADPILRSIYNNQTVRENYRDIDWGDVLYQIELGALSGGVLGSLGMANGQFRGKNAALNQRVVTEVVNDVLANTEEGQAVAERVENSPVGENPADTPAPENERLFHEPVNRSGANRILFDPEQRAAFEAETGVSLSNMSVRDAANLIMEYSRQSAETGQTGFDLAYPIRTPQAPNQFDHPFTRSEAQQVANDPTLRALFEQETGRKIPGKKYAVQFIQNVTAQLAEQANAPAAPTSPIAEAILNNEQQVTEQTPQTEAPATAPVPTPAQPAPTEQAPVNAPAQQTATAQQAERPGTTVRPVRPAPRTAEGTKLSASVETVQNSPVTSPEFSGLIDQTVSERGYRYIPITNNETVKKATDLIKRVGWNAARADWTSDVRQGKTSAQMMAVGALLYNNAVNAGDMKAAAEIMADYVAAGTNTAQALQARQIISSMQPEMRLYMIERTLRQLSESVKNKLPDGIQISDELRDRYLKAETDEERDAVIVDMQKEVAKQVPASFKDQWTALRYVNMLGNFRTQARNILGNLSMSLLTSTKNAVQTALEGAAYLATGGKTQRTTSLVANRDLVNAAKAYYNAHADVINGEGKYSDNRTATGFMKGVEDQRTIFGKGARSEWASNLASRIAGRDVEVQKNILEDYRRATNWAMTRGDTVFIGGRFARTLAGYLQVNGMDAATFSGIQDGSIQPTAEQQTLIDNAVNYATQEAQEATFHDNNALSNWISKIGRRKDTNKIGKLISEGIMPFRKTPANVLIRAEEYSPLGFVNATVKAIQASRGTGNVTSSDVINSLSKAFTGSGIFLLGMLLRNAGWLTGEEDDEKQDEFNDLRGGQAYALTLPDGTSYTLDWVSPTAVPLFLGVQMMDEIQDGGFQLKDLEAAFTRITNPMIQMSMLQGVNDTLDNIKYSDNNLVQIALNSALSYLTQGLTNTMAGQLERTLEDRRTSTYVDKDSDLPAWLQRAIGKAGEKIPIPGADFQQVEYLDAWGRPDSYESNPFARAIENFLSPGYVSHDNSTAVDDELQRLYDAGMGNVFPQRISMTDKISTYDAHGQKTGERQLTADEYVQVQRQAGQGSLRMVQDLIGSAMYDAMSDEAKAEAISAIYQFNRYQALRGVEPSMEDKYSDIAGLSNIPAYFATREAYQDAAGNRWNRDYDELGDIMDSYSTLAPDVQKYLEDKNSQIRKVHDAYEQGVQPRSWFQVYDKVQDLTPYGDNAGVSAWQKYETVVQTNPQQADALLQSYMPEETYARYQTARDFGVSPDLWAGFYKQYSMNNGRKAASIDWMLQQGYSKKQAEYMYYLFKEKVADLPGFNDSYR